MLKTFLRALLKPFSFVPALMMMYLIFSFSAQDGTASGNLSYKVSEIIVESANEAFELEWSDDQIDYYIERIHHPVRKLAHMTEYFLLAVSVSFPLYVYGVRGLWLPILAGCVVGSITSMGSVFLLCRLFGLDEAMTWSLLPKSVTTPIAVGIAESHGGISSITVAAVILTGIMGSILAPFLIRIFRVKDSMTAGLAIGACSHAVGTSKAIEIGETEGAMSGLAIGICGIVTVVFSMFL